MKTIAAMVLCTVWGKKKKDFTIKRHFNIYKNICNIFVARTKDISLDKQFLMKLENFEEITRNILIGEDDSILYRSRDTE